jgi:hypothetical protein
VSFATWWCRKRVLRVLCATTVVLLSGACGSSHAVSRATSSTYARGPADSTYWVAGWLPAGARLQNAFSWAHPAADSPVAQVEYGASESDAGVQISVYTNARTAQRVAVCSNPGSITSVHRATVQGHSACEGSNYDDGSAFGWITQWTPRSGLTIEVSVGEPEAIPEARAIARKIAAAAYPASSEVWSRLVRMTTRNPDLTRANPDYRPSRAASGARWTGHHGR